MSFNVVLIEPEIPNNTGNIGRLCLASGCKLHLVKPFGFEITDARLKRAGLDYWEHLNPIYYDSLDDFLERNTYAKFALLSAKAKKSYLEIPFEKDLFLLFGKESAGLPEELTKEYSNELYKIPIHSERIRSLNLGNSVGIVVYEGLRVIGE